MKRQILRISAITLASAGLAIGIAAASSATIDTTGPDSHQSIELENHNSADIHNDNDISVNNSNRQSAESGDASVRHNTTGGDATSGDASNSNDTNTDVSVSNGMSGLGNMFGGSSNDSASIGTTGPDSSNRIEIENSNRLDVRNNNDVTVNNTNCQSASTGDAKVSDNTTGGNATSGSATNTNSTSSSVTISN